MNRCSWVGGWATNARHDPCTKLSCHLILRCTAAIDDAAEHRCVMGSAGNGRKWPETRFPGFRASPFCVASTHGAMVRCALEWWCVPASCQIYCDNAFDLFL